MGGLVTWEKFWRKKWCRPRYLSDSTAMGLSSPIEPMASLPSSTIGWRISSMSSMVMPKAIWRRRSSAFSMSDGSPFCEAVFTSSSRCVVFLTQLPHGF